MENKIKILAVDIIEFYRDLFPFEGTFSEALEGVINTYKCLMAGETSPIIEDLKGLRDEVEDGWATWTCDDLIERLEAL